MERRRTGWAVVRSGRDRRSLPRPALLALVLVLVLARPAGPAAAAPTPASAPAPLPGLADAGALDTKILVELKYASTDNFMRRNVYGSLRRCFLQPEAARKLAVASRALRAQRPDLRLLVYDCARPLAVQRLMWDLVKGTPSQRYVANPATGSMHNYGCAVDLTLAGKDGKPLDLGSPFDGAGAAAQPRLELARLKAGQLAAAPLANRLLLRQVMVQAGFFPLEIEWWHFDCALPGAAKKRFTPVP